MSSNTNGTHLAAAGQGAVGKMPPAGGVAGGNSWNETRLNEFFQQVAEPTRTAARGYMSRGWRIVPVPQGKKGSRTEGWTDLVVTEENFDTYFPPDDPKNVAVIFGAGSGNLVDVDLDCLEALPAGQVLLPKTGAIFGRTGKPRSHYLYRLDPLAAKPLKLVDPFRKPAEGNVLVELRASEGLCTNFPPSVVTGEGKGRREYAWDNDGEPAEVAQTVLLRAVYKVAAAALLARYMAEGTRHDTAMALRGALAEAVRRQQMTEGDVEEFLIAVTEAAGDEETLDRIRDLDRELDRLNNDDPVRGWTTVGKLLMGDQEKGKQLTEQVQQWLVGPLDLDSAGEAGGGVDEDFNDPHRLAHTFLSQQPWKFWQNRFWKYDGTRYVEVPGHELESLVTTHIKREFDRQYRIQLSAYEAESKKQPAGGASGVSVRPKVAQVTGAVVSNVIRALKGLTLVPGAIPQPSMLPKGELRNLLAFENGLLDLDTQEARPLTAEWFSPICLPYPYDPAAKPPARWLGVLHRNLGGDAKRIALLQEMFGYMLVPTTLAQKFFVLVGEGGNGKSVIIAALEAMVGMDNLSTVAFEMFGERFMLYSTLGKLVNICAEVGEVGQTHEGLLKAFTSGDPMQFEQKGKDPFSARPTARLVIATNNIPRFSDKSEGVWRRMVLIPFNTRIPEGEQVRGMDQPEFWTSTGELPGILNWAMEGLRRLKANGWRFTSPAACEAALDNHRLESNPARRFLSEQYIYDPDAAPQPSETMFSGYTKWCQANGYRPLSAGMFGKEVHRAFPLAKRH